MRALARNLIAGKPFVSRATPTNSQLAGMALDGPRGPRHAIQPGTQWLSQFSGIPVVPVYIRAPFAFRLNSWDRSLIPLPFSVVEVRLGQSFHPTDTAQIKAAMLAVEHPISTADIYIQVPQPV